MKKWMVVFSFVLTSVSKIYSAWNCNSCWDGYFAVGAGVVIPSKNSSSEGNSTSILFTPTVPRTSLFILPNVDWKNTYHVGYELYALAGTYFCPCWRADLEFVYQNFRRKIKGSYDWKEIDAITTELFASNVGNPIHEACTQAHLFCLMPNLYYDIWQNCFWKIFVGAGCGIAWLRSSSTLQNNTLVISILNESAPTIEKSPSLGGTAFVWQVKAGFTYDIKQDLALGINYRLLGTTKFQAYSSSITTNPNTAVQSIFTIGQRDLRGVLNHSVNLSLIYKF